MAHWSGKFHILNEGTFSDQKVFIWMSFRKTTVEDHSLVAESSFK